jgi:hypothetical protein
MWLLGGNDSQKRRVIEKCDQEDGQLITECYCQNGHSILSDNCGAHLVALFTSPKTQFSHCVGLCQRIGCLHSELISERDLRLFSRQDYF